MDGRTCLGEEVILRRLLNLWCLTLSQVASLFCLFSFYCHMREIRSELLRNGRRDRKPGPDPCRKERPQPVPSFRDCRCPFWLSSEHCFIGRRRGCSRVPTVPLEAVVCARSYTNKMSISEIIMSPHLDRVSVRTHPRDRVPLC